MFAKILTHVDKLKDLTVFVITVEGIPPLGLDPPPIVILAVLIGLNGGEKVALLNEVFMSFNKLTYVIS
jgi:hypothetical protein